VSQCCTFILVETHIISKRYSDSSTLYSLCPTGYFINPLTLSHQTHPYILLVACRFRCATTPMSHYKVSRLEKHETFYQCDLNPSTGVGHGYASEASPPSVAMTPSATSATPMMPGRSLVRELTNQTHHVTSL